MTTASELKSMIDKFQWYTKVRCICCKDELPDKHLDNEWGIVLLASSDSDITSSHWVAYFIKTSITSRGSPDTKKYYFCSYGSPICSELKDYLGDEILGHTFRIQDFNESICGELCIVFCYLMDKGIRYEDIVINLAL